MRSSSIKIGAVAAGILLICAILAALFFMFFRDGAIFGGEQTEVSENHSQNPERKEKGDSDGVLRIIYETAEENPSKQDMEDTIYILQKRAELYTEKANVYQRDERSIIAELPGEEESDEIIKALGRPGKLEFFEQTEGGYSTELVLDGSSVKDAKAEVFDSADGGKDYAVQLILTEDGAVKFEDITAGNIGNEIWIMFDDENICSPVIHDVIKGGKVMITGMESKEEAEELAAMFRIGALPLELKYAGTGNKSTLK